MLISSSVTSAFCLLSDETTSWVCICICGMACVTLLAFGLKIRVVVAVASLVSSLRTGVVWVLGGVLGGGGAPIITTG